MLERRPHIISNFVSSTPEKIHIVSKLLDVQMFIKLDVLPVFWPILPSHKVKDGGHVNKTDSDWAATAGRVNLTLLLARDRNMLE